MNEQFVKETQQSFAIKTTLWRTN